MLPATGLSFFSCKDELVDTNRYTAEMI
ncbi:uncharacterized protein METZ01_LOCUS63613 [marine metagenome]|uniref:Uncharacterized protein n=1 Tax=marine metagenome TaxID=408172 RepID=A0A381T4U3_9ZZZZ